MCANIKMIVGKISSMRSHLHSCAVLGAGLPRFRPCGIFRKWGGFVKNLRRRFFEIIEVSQGDLASAVYDYVMMAAILVSLVPLAFKGTNTLFVVIDRITVTLFIIDYVLREWTADLHLRKGALSFVLYPITPMALIDLLSILPSFCPLSAGFKVLRLLRLVRTFRVFRAFKMLRYSKSMTIITRVIKAQRAPLLAVCTLAIAYVLISALVIFNVEPDTFATFFEAIYWACVSLTTMGYGDIYPVTTAGRIVTILSSFVGIAIVALPAGIITAGYMDEISKSAK